MKPRRSWQALAQVPTRTLRHRQDKALARYLREELYALSPHYRRVLDEAGVDVRRVRGVGDLAGLPLTEHADLEANPQNFILRPTPHAMREHWGFTRKLALALGGERAGQALRRGYELASELPMDARLRQTACTRHDLDLLAEVGLRAALQLNLAPGSRLVSTLHPEGSTPSTLAGALLAGAQDPQASSGEPLHVTCPGGAHARGLHGSGRTTPNTDEILAALDGPEPSALIARPEILSQVAQTALDDSRSFPHIRWLIVVGSAAPDPKEAAAWVALAPAARVARIHGHSECPMAFVEGARPVATMAEAPEAGTGFIVHPDLCILEIIDPDTLQPVAEGHPGEVVYSSLAAHGRALLRYRTGEWAESGLVWTPDSNGSLPRLSSRLRPLKPTPPDPDIA
ncbi:MAG: hypothetical protein QF404_09145 [Planctomycetota bacterium]|jgi:hypothetical protein|nr:hypothetical protein [Planctomycetota bacterium]MDP6937784.1 hypothetical protein [Planctomycetota bacterium]